MEEELHLIGSSSGRRPEVEFVRRGKLRKRGNFSLELDYLKNLIVTQRY